MTGLFRTALVCAALISVSSAALAQAVRGTIERTDGGALTLRSTEGVELKLTLADNAMIVAVVKGSLADIKEGSYVGTAAMPQADGSQKALEIRIFPEEMRGVGEGHRPYAPVPNSTMTNGATSGPMVTSVDGSTVVVKYKEGEKKIVVSKDTPILRYVIGNRSDLQPGARFSVNTPVRKPDGSIEASRINVGRDGVVPP
jgi:hypothetical protein